MDAGTQTGLRAMLGSRRERLVSAIREVGEAADLVVLLQEVDAALERMDGGTYGNCAVCHEPFDEDELRDNPLIQYCLCRLDEAGLEALQTDLNLATRIQRSLLPEQDLSFGGWHVHHRYQPLGAVGGDYCDLVAQQSGDQELYLLLGDVSGKGVAASLLMARLNALFRSLIPSGLAVSQLVERTNDLFAESSMSSQYATLVCARADRRGEVEVCNAGHCGPLLLRDGKVEMLTSTGFPVGLFADKPYHVQKLALQPGQTLFLYSDGLTEAVDANGVEYGVERVSHVLREAGELSPSALAGACLQDLEQHLAGAPRSDDLSIMVVRRQA
jgi:sigma-B regulation protein RsbU (phosphoserine phosphatase)